MLRYKTETRPGLVALYNIRPGNWVGQFLQPRNPHGAACQGLDQQGQGQGPSLQGPGQGQGLDLQGQGLKFDP